MSDLYRQDLEARLLLEIALQGRQGYALNFDAYMDPYAEELERKKLIEVAWAERDAWLTPQGKAFVGMNNSGNLRLITKGTK